MQTRAIILKKQSTSEYDQWTTCYTEKFGKVMAVAKSILKPNSIQAMHLDVFNLVEFELISGRGAPIITGAQAENVFGGLKSSLPALAAAYFFAEAIDKLAFEYQEDEGLWKFLTGLFGDLNREPSNNENDIRRLFREGQARLLSILGYQPNWGECGFCAVPVIKNKIIFSSEIKGAMCRDCFFQGRPGLVVKNQDLISGRILDDLFEAIIEKKLFSLNFIHSVLE